MTADVHQSLAKMGRLVKQIQNGQWRGFDGSPIKSVVNIGVGGSNLGPLLACDALEQYASEELGRLDVHFVSSMDGSELEKLLPTLEPATTLFIISSKKNNKLRYKLYAHQKPVYPRGTRITKFHYFNTTNVEDVKNGV